MAEKQLSHSYVGYLAAVLLLVAVWWRTSSTGAGHNPERMAKRVNKTLIKYNLQPGKITRYAAGQCANVEVSCRARCCTRY